MKTKRLFVACLLAAGALGAAAQTGTDLVPPARMKQWLDAKFTYSGTDHATGCAFMNSGHPRGRVLFFVCPNGDTLKLEGRAKVQGGQYCNDFPAPVGKECFSWKTDADGRFEQVRDGRAIASGYIISAVPLK